MKKVLFVVNGFGLGNSTRIHAILENLNNKCQVDLCTSANSFNYFKLRTNLYQNIYELNSLTYHPGKILQLISLKSNRVAFKSNINTLHRILDQNNYSLIVVDSDYVAPLVARKMGIKVLSINNSFNGLKNFNPALMFKSVRQFFIEGMDYLFQQMTAQYIIVPTFNQKTYSKGKCLYLPPIVRRGLDQKNKTYEVERVLLLFSGASINDYSEEVRDIIVQNPNVCFSYAGDNPWDFGNVKKFNKYDDSIKLVNEHDFIISNAGFSSLSEIVYSRTRALILPIKGHYEQLINAQLLHNHDWVYRLKDLKGNNLNSLLKKKIEHYEVEDNNECSAKLAADYILGVL